VSSPVVVAAPSWLAPHQCYEHPGRHPTMPQRWPGIRRYPNRARDGRRRPLRPGPRTPRRHRSQDGVRSSGGWEPTSFTLPVVTAEADSLVSYLDQQRESVLDIVDGLPEAALRRAVFPSGWTCLGLIHHAQPLPRGDRPGQRHHRGHTPRRTGPPPGSTLGRLGLAGARADGEPALDHLAHDRGNRPARGAPRHRAGTYRRPHRPRCTDRQATATAARIPADRVGKPGRQGGSHCRAE